MNDHYPEWFSKYDINYNHLENDGDFNRWKQNEQICYDNKHNLESQYFDKCCFEKVRLDRGGCAVMQYFILSEVKYPSKAEQTKWSEFHELVASGYVNQESPATAEIVHKLIKQYLETKVQKLKRISKSEFYKR